MKVCSNTIPTLYKNYFRMGFSLALGALPSFMIKGRLQSILQTLIKATEITRKEAAWAKSRRDALRAING